MQNSPNCPICGKFMMLIPTDPGDLPGYYQWMCNDENCLHCAHLIPAPEYDWLILQPSEEELERLHIEEPEVYAAFMEHKRMFDERPYRSTKINWW